MITGRKGCTMNIIKLSKKISTNFRETDFPVESINFPINQVCKLDDIELDDYIITIAPDEEYNLYRPLIRGDYVFPYYCLVETLRARVIYEGNSLKEIVNWAKINIDNFRNAKQIFVLRPEKSNKTKKDNGPHIVK